jgi:hypothetical protein
MGDERRAGAARTALRALLAVAGVAVGVALALQLPGPDLPYADLLAPCVVAGVKAGDHLGGVPAGWLLVTLAGIYGLAVGLLLSAGWRGWVLVVILFSIHVVIGRFLLEPEAARQILAAAAELL